ncbi:MAG: M28 family peptidase [Myxococcaceae bacterium]|nr:M28 family peptidase [Myxococcaceae bacterium]
MSVRPVATILGLLGLASLAVGTVWTVWTVKQPLSAEPGCTPGPVTAERLRVDVRTLSEELVPRDAAHPEGMARAADFVAMRLRETGGRVREEELRVHGARYRNVVATFGPESGQRVVVGAHYDTDGPLPGADDNASGVAGLLALARLLGERPPPLRVDLVAFALEEQPHFRTSSMGSAVFARSLREAGVRVRAMLSLECIGSFSDAPGSQQYPVPLLGALYPDTGNFIAVVGRLGEERRVRRVKGAMAAASPLPVESINARAWSARCGHWRPQGRRDRRASRGPSHASRRHVSCFASGKDTASCEPCC